MIDRRLWLAVVILLLIQATVEAATLKSNATVTADVIRVGDLFTGAGSARGKVVGSAPAPGKRDIFGVRRLREIARRYNLDWAPNGRHVKTVVIRAGKPITRAEIEKKLRSALIRGGADNAIRVTLYQKDIKVHAPLKGGKPYWFEDLRHNRRGGRVKATMVVPTGKHQRTRVALSGRIDKVVELPVLTRRLGRGDIVSRGDIEWHRVREARVRGNILTDANSIVGRAARHVLRPGVPLRRNDLQTPILVGRGSLVTLLLRTGRMILTTKGKSMEDGALGQTIRVMNIRSKRIIEGIVEGPGRMRIPGAGDIPPQSRLNASLKGGKS